MAVVTVAGTPSPLPTAADVVLTLLAAGVAGWLAQRRSLPGGPLVWALFAAAALHLALPGLAPLPAWMRTAAQIGIGTVLGAEISRDPLRAVWSALGPVAAVLALLLTGVAGVAAVLAAMTPLDPVTALLVAAPGGATDMSALALAVRADASVVAGLHVLRQIVVFVVVTALLRRLFRRPQDPPPAG